MCYKSGIDVTQSQIFLFFLFSTECPNTNEELMTSRLQSQGMTQHITQTDFLSHTADFDGEKLLFSKVFAWCVQKNKIGAAPYPDHAQVDLGEDYLVYGLRVDGYRNQTNVMNDANIAKQFKIQYGMVGTSGSPVYAWYNGAVVSRIHFNVDFILPLNISSHCHRQLKCHFLEGENRIGTKQYICNNMMQVETSIIEEFVKC